MHAKGLRNRKTRLTVGAGRPRTLPCAAALAVVVRANPQLCMRLGTAGSAPLGGIAGDVLSPRQSNCYGPATPGGAGGSGAGPGARSRLAMGGGRHMQVGASDTDWWRRGGMRPAIGAGR